ncbi:transient receptor potential cation channel trpm-like [Teleopsis dalmanni]|uniref:transient receptor potential cation channel trpm-like n=1 Tax=Teleopsis dalmanni TaxID=139649 RepID=UPI0018CDFF33|nr:transient receptor potential cation channel trpm-like [Teleopsis dalmanni]
MGLNLLKSSLDRPKTEMSKAEFAAMLEKQHLKECEENDYMMLEGLFQARASIDNTNGSFETGISIDYSHRYPLRRETAIELSPSKPSAEGDVIGCSGSSDTSGAGSAGYTCTAATITTGQSGFEIRNERPWHRNSSMEQQQSYQSPVVPTRATSEFLNAPYESSHRLFKKSSESLQKNSSTETDYSAHPYRFIKQSSNDTTTSMTGSYNIDNISLAPELSLDAGDSPSQMQSQTTVPTVVETIAVSTTRAAGGTSSSGYASGVVSTSGRYQPIRTSSVGAADLRRRRGECTSSLDIGTSAIMSQVQPPPPRALQLKKQFSLDQGKQQQTPTATHADTSSSSAAITKPTPAKLSSSLKPPPPAGKLGLNVLNESSSSTEESKDGDLTGAAGGLLTIPQISTHNVQDEIAKLSLNIKSSTESEKDPPYNETMC